MLSLISRFMSSASLGLVRECLEIFEEVVERSLKGTSEGLEAGREETSCRRSTSMIFWDVYAFDTGEGDPRYISLDD